MSLRKLLLDEEEEEEDGANPDGSVTGKAASALSSSGFSDAPPPTLSSLSSPGVPAVAPAPRSSAEARIAEEVGGAAPELAPGSVNGGVDGVGTADDVMEDDLFAFAGNSYKAGSEGDSAGPPGGGGGGGAAGKVFVQPLPLTATKG